MNSLVRNISFVAMLAGSVCATSVFAQRADVPIELEKGTVAGPAALEKLAELKSAGKLMSISQVTEAMKAPTPEAIVLPRASTERLQPSTIAAKARKSVVKIGWYYLCNRCDKWHTNFAGGYIVAAGGVAVTCHHVIAPKPDMREGYLVAQDSYGGVYAIERILASDAAMDSAVVRLQGAEGLPAIPLNDQVGPGDAVYLLSDPKGYTGYFSAGIVNRFYWQGAAGDPHQLGDARRLRINVSTDWAPGSSGSPVLDEYGNAICHVSKIRTESGEPNGNIPPPSGTAGGAKPDAAAPTTGPAGPRDYSADAPPITAPPTTGPSRPRSQTPGAPGGTQIVLHEGIPSRGVLLQIEQTNDAAKPPATTSPVD